MDDLSRIERMYGSVNEYYRQQDEHDRYEDSYEECYEYEPDPNADRVEKCPVCGKEKLRKDGWIGTFTGVWYCSEECDNKDR